MPTPPTAPLSPAISQALTRCGVVNVGSWEVQLLAAVERARVARIGNDLLKRQVDNVHGNVLGMLDARTRGPRKRNGVGSPFRFRRGLSGRQAFVFLGFTSKRNETGVFSGVTGKALRWALPYTQRPEGTRTNSLGYAGL